MKKAYLLLLFIVSITLEPVFSENDFYKQLADSALMLTKQKVVYDPSYVRLDYPNGDVPADRGVSQM